MWVHDRTASSSLQRGAYDGYHSTHAPIRIFVGSHPERWSLPSQTGRAPRKLLARERRALWPLMGGAFSGGVFAKPLRRSFSNFTIDGRVSQKFSSATPLGPDMPSMWVLTHKAPTKRAKDIAC